MLVALAIAGLLFITAGCATEAARPAAVGLAVHGNQLMYRDQPVRLRGIAVGDIYYWRQRDAAAEYRSLAADWNANVVRLSIHPGTWREHRQESLDLLREHVRLALANGLFVIINYHAIGFPDGYYQKLYLLEDSRSVTESYDSRFALARDFWSAVSRTIRDPRVMFELWNEPVSAEDEDLATAARTWPKLKKYFQTLTAVIRRNGCGSVILATGGNWAYCLRGIKADLLPDPQTAYTWHVYAGHDGNDPAKWAAALDDLNTVRPVIVTEWGFEPDAKGHYKGTAETFGRRFRDEFLEDKSLHSLAWCWIPEWGPSLQRNDWKTRTPWGDFVFEYLQKANANPTRP